MAEIANILVDQGANYTTPLEITDASGNPINLTGWTAEAHIRKHFSSTTNKSFIITFDADRTTGLIEMALPGSNSTVMVPGRYLYDLRMLDANSAPYRIIQGTLTIDGAITRD